MLPKEPRPPGWVGKFLPRLTLLLDDSNMLFIDGKSVQLTACEARIINSMATRKPRAMTFVEVILASRDSDHPERTVNVNLARNHIRNLRLKIQHLTDEEVIQRVYGIGYRMPNDLHFMCTFDEGDAVVVPTEAMERITHMSYRLGSNPKEVLTRMIEIGEGVLLEEIEERERAEAEAEEELTGDMWQ